jgi:hypothetical protein
MQHFRHPSAVHPLEEGKALLLDIHEGIYGHHASSRSMVRKAFR